MNNHFRFWVFVDDGAFLISKKHHHFTFGFPVLSAPCGALPPPPNRRPFDSNSTTTTGHLFTYWRKGLNKYISWFSRTSDQSQHKFHSQVSLGEGRKTESKSIFPGNNWLAELWRRLHFYCLFGADSARQNQYSPFVSIF